MPAGVSMATTRPSRNTATRSARRSASSMRWVTSRIVTPRSRIDSMTRQVSRRACGSRPGRQLVEDGDPRPPDEGQRDRQPLLLAAGQVPIGGVAAGRRDRGRRAAASGPPARRRTRRTGRAPRAPSCARAARSPGAARRRGSADDRGRGAGRGRGRGSRPPSGVRRPAIDSTVVVLPAPFGPRIPKISPSSTVNETPSTARRWP